MSEGAYDGPERRQELRLSEEQLDEIADRAFEKAKQQIYSEVGKGVVRAVLYLGGAGLTFLAAWTGVDKFIPK